MAQHGSRFEISEVMTSKWDATQLRYLSLLRQAIDERPESMQQGLVNNLLIRIDRHGDVSKELNHILRGDGASDGSGAKHFNPNAILSRAVTTARCARFLCPDGKPGKGWIVFETRSEAYEAVKREKSFAVNDMYLKAKGAIDYAAHKAGREKALLSGAETIRGIITRRIKRNSHISSPSLQLACDQAFLDFMLDIGSHMTSDLKYEGKEVCEKFAKDRAMVWKKGYGCLGDVNGRLYVYKRMDDLPAFR